VVSLSVHPRFKVQDSAIRLSSVQKSFGSTVAVRELDLDVPRGSIYGLLGPNGAGKTTTIRMILDILGPDAGEVEVFGRRVDDEARSRVGYLPEERGLYQKMPVREHIVFLAELKGMDRARAQDEATRWLEELELADRADDRVDSLSKGMQQKVQFVATIIHEPDLLILDEPFSGLDPINVHVLRRIVLERNRAGATILFSTHMIEDAESLCDRVCMIAGARKVLDGRVSDVKEEAGEQQVVLEVGGDGAFLDRTAGVVAVSRRDDCVEARLSGDVDAGAVLRAALDAGAEIRRFERVRPSLRQIFLHKARTKGIEGAARGDGADGAGPPSINPSEAPDTGSGASGHHVPAASQGPGTRPDRSTGQGGTA
jgi:ABC-2 type transport system ATP-binding protein